MLRSLKECTLNGNILQPKCGVDKENLYKFLRELIYDAKLPINKPIGVYVSSGALQKNNVTKKNMAICENLITLSNNLDIVFPGFTGTSVTLEMKEGVVTTSNTKFFCDAKVVAVLEEDKYLYTAMEPCTLQIICKEWTGRRSILEAYKKVNNKKYLPIATMFSLIDYIRILPFDGEIRIKFLGKMTWELFSRLLDRYEILAKTGKLGKEECAWALRSMD